MPKPKPGNEKAGGVKRPRKTKAEEKKDRCEVERSVDDALEDSFPASDPPPWTLGRKDPQHAPDDERD